MQFNEMNLSEKLLSAIQKAGYTTPTPIQQATIELVLNGKDVIACAQTGTGKTAAFALPILQLIAERKNALPYLKKTEIKSLILTPTRELAMQIFENFEQYGKELKLRTAVIFGGVNQAPQVTRLRNGVDIVVATPGRLNDLINQGFVDLSKIDIFVLDEADRMLDMGFIKDVKKIIARIPQKRQTLLFSATMPNEVEGLARTILTDPETIKVDSVTCPVDVIEQEVYYVDRENKLKLLMHLIKEKNAYTVLVFTRTKHGADKIVHDLGKNNISAMAIHSNKSQIARQTALKMFKTGKINVLVATDIAARGIDIVQLPYVVNFDIPEEAETYIHRIGRTGRAGREGNAISFCCYNELNLMRKIERLIGKPVPSTTSPWPLENLVAAPPRVFNRRAASSGNRAKSQSSKRKF